jgi:hypothetical protein
MKVYTMKNNGHMYVEEIPTNTVSSGAIAGLPPDEPPVKKRKKKFKTDMFSRIRNSKLKEETMEDITLITEADPGNNETASAMRFIQQKRKLAKKQEREKRGQLRKQEIQTLSKAKAKDYQNKASERQKKVARDINKASKDTMKDSFEFDIYRASFAELNPNFGYLPEELQYKIVEVWMELSEDNQDKMAYLICEENGIEMVTKFVETL